MTKKNQEVETKDVATTQTNALATAERPELGFGAAEDIGQKDIKIDRILLTQAMSKKVQADEVEKGKLIVQSTLEILGGHKPAEKMAFIPIKAMKYWTETDKDSKEFLGRFPAISSDELPWEEQRGARTIKRTFTHSFIVLLPSKIAGMEDTPMELAFRSTNLDCAKAINTILLNMKRRNVPSWKKVFELKVDTKSNDKGTWYVTVASIARDTSAEELAAAEAWVKILNDASVNLADEENAGEAASSEAGRYNDEQVDY
jgi:hypothetical protein